METTKKRILLVEDDKAIANAMKMKLTASSYEAEIAGNGSAALEAIASSNYNLILLDLIMPDMDGFNFLEKMKEKGINIPVIILSNLGQDEDIKRAKELGAKDYFVKSDTSLSTVIEKISKYLS